MFSACFVGSQTTASSDVVGFVRFERHRTIHISGIPSDSKDLRFTQIRIFEADCVWLYTIYNL